MNGIYLFLYIYNFNNFINGTTPEMGVYNVTASRDRFAPAWQSIHVWLSWRGTSGVCMVKINEMIYTLLSISSEMLAFLITQGPAWVCLLSVNFSNSIFNLQSISTKIRLLKTFQLLNMLSSSRLSFCYSNLLLFICKTCNFIIVPYVLEFLWLFSNTFQYLFWSHYWSGVTVWTDLILFSSFHATRIVISQIIVAYLFYREILF